MTPVLSKLFLLLILMGWHPNFRENQLKYSRVRKAYAEKEIKIKASLNAINVQSSSFELFLRALKREEVLEVWVRNMEANKYVLLYSYPFCSVSGDLGPKRREGDRQIPEGIYYISHFNPVSNFHLSLGIDYPNASDKILGDQKHPGGAIYIHGNCVTIGCIPVTDDKIKELYVLAVEARNNGQQKIPVHIFPTRLTQGSIERLNEATSASPSTINFWKNLEPLFMDFETTHQLKNIKVDGMGRYFFQ